MRASNGETLVFVGCFTRGHKSRAAKLNFLINIAIVINKMNPEDIEVIWSHIDRCQDKSFR